MSGAKDTALHVFVRARPVLDPPLLAAAVRLGRRGHRARPDPVRLTAYAVYRARNARLVRQFLDELPPRAVAHLHALDVVAPTLRHETRSEGPGLRMPLLQRLLDENAPDPGNHVLVHDDDVTFVGDGGGRFAGLAAAAGLDISQPAHVRGSHATFHSTRMTPLSTVRQTRFVEVGPVVLFSPRAQELVLPFPASARMGWGLDIAWSRLRERGLLLGVVDATPVMHHGVVGAAYESQEEALLRDEALVGTAETDAHGLAGNVGLTWRPWQQHPRWRADSTSTRSDF